MNAPSSISVGPHQLGIIENNRRRHLFEHIDLSGRGLEVGPYEQPTVFRSEADILYLDRQSRDELVAACPDPTLAAKIPEVDILAATNDYRQAVDTTFDYIIANHVLEHVPNAIEWLATVNAMLSPGGILFMALPDKKFTFDKFRPDTPFSHILTDYLEGVSESPLEHLIEIEVYYDRAFVGKRMDLKERLDIGRLRELVGKKPHLGLHSHVFQSETFLTKLMKPIIYMGLVDFRIVAFHGSSDNYGEFHVVLQKASPDVSLEESEFYTEDFKPSAAIQASLDDARSRADTLTEEVRQRAAENSARAAENSALEERLLVAKAEFAAAQAIIDQLRASRSWRWTSPIRGATTELRRWKTILKR